MSKAMLNPFAGELQLYPTDTEFTKTTAGQTINVATAAELTTALANLAAAPSLLGNVIILCAAGTYADAISIPSLIGNGYSLTVSGGTTTNLNTTATGGTAGNINTQATVIKTLAGWAVNAYRGQWLKFTSGLLINQIYIVDDNTSDTITLCGAYLSSIPANGDSFIIYSNSAIITGDITVSPTTCPLNLTNINFKSLKCTGLSTGTLTEIKQIITVDSSFSKTRITASSMDYIRCSFDFNATLGHIWNYGSILTFHSCYGYGNSHASTFHTKTQAGGHVLYEFGCVLDAFNTAAIFGIGGSGNVNAGDNLGVETIINQTYVHLKNSTTGILANFGGLCNGQNAINGNNGIELCTTFKNPVTTDPAYISATV